METLYPIFYGTRMVPFSVLEETFAPKMHPEFWRRLSNFILAKGGLFGIGGGFRGATQQPNKPGFAPPGQSFHQAQVFPSGIFYSAVDMVVVNPGGVHKAPKWLDVPKQGSPDAAAFGVHMNIDDESWHNQPVELDGWGTWVARGRKDLEYGRAILIYNNPPPPPVQPPVPPTQPPSNGVIVEFTSRNLTLGAVGPDVKFFQRLLNEIAGQGLLLDGYYGPATVTAVTNWQRYFGAAAGLSVDGELGPKTQRSLIEVALQVS